MQITKFPKEMEETNWGKKFLEIVPIYKFPLQVDPMQVKILLKDLLQEGDYMINIPNSKDDSIQQLLIAGNYAYKLSAVGIHNLGLFLPPISLDSHLSQIQQDEILY